MSSLSVCIPCYNYGRYLRCAVEPILRSGLEDVRVLIIDDCSTDDTADRATRYARRDSRITYRRNERRLGNVRTYNRGIAWADREYFLLLSADDMVFAKHLRYRLEFLTRYPGVVFSYAPIYRFYMDGSRASLRIPIGHEEISVPQVLSGAEFLRRSLETRWCLTPYLTTIVRTEAIQKMGGYRPEHPVAGDLELWLRLACLGDVAYHPTPGGLYRRHGRNMSNHEQQTDRIHAFAAFESAMDTVVRRYPELAPAWSRSKRGWARDLFVAAGSSLESGRRREAERAVEKARQIDRSLVSTAWHLRLAARRLAGERLWRWLRSAARQLSIV